MAMNSISPSFSDISEMVLKTKKRATEAQNVPPPIYIIASHMYTWYSEAHVHMVLSGTR